MTEMQVTNKRSNAQYTNMTPNVEQKYAKLERT